MAVAGRPSEPGADSVAGVLRDAGFARLFVAADADSLSAAGLLANALSQQGVPFQVSVHDGPHAPSTTDDTTTISIGTDSPATVSLVGNGSASETAFAACRALGTDPDPLLALAGGFVTSEPSEFEGCDAFETARERDLIEQRPGVAVPVADLDDGLCHTTLAHTAFSGDIEATTAALSGFDGDTDRRRIASLLTLSVCDGDSTPRAATAVERALKPYAITDHGRDDATVSARFETVGGFADVLRATARERPGVGLALALGHDVREPALAVWRTHAERAHTALRAATTERHRNLFVARIDAGSALSTAARLLGDFRSPESISVVVGDTRAAAVACDDSGLGDRLAEAGAAAEGDGGGDERRGWARFENPDAFVSALREAVA